MVNFKYASNKKRPDIQGQKICKNGYSKNSIVSKLGLNFRVIYKNITTT